MVRKSVHIVFLMLVISSGMAQVPGVNPYVPENLMKTDWSFAGQLYFTEASSSNDLSNEFLREVNQSGFLEDDLKSGQIDKLSKVSKACIRREIGGDLFFRNNNRFWFASFSHQYVLDAQLDRDLLKLLLNGNKPYAGKTMMVPGSEYYSIYFNQLKAGIGFSMQMGELTQTFSASIGLIAGQNYDELKVENSSFYTHPDGDYLDVNLHAETRLSDTSWAKFTEISGMGVGGNLYYSMLKEKNFFVSAEIKNLGFISWNKNPYTALIDTNIVFNGLEVDTTANGNDLPDDFSFDNLRRIAFKNPEYSSFAASLPLLFELSGGKYL
ncbi:MAG: hypothetical protein KDC05_03215, partial [Bacteroidales bacterium]|nr:hypothetical protein [Bacteroidales bacterium]